MLIFHPRYYKHLHPDSYGLPDRLTGSQNLSHHLLLDIIIQIDGELRAKRLSLIKIFIVELNLRGNIGQIQCCYTYNDKRQKKSCIQQQLNSR